MSAPGITYEGVLAQKGSNKGEKADVFQNVKFWVSAQVPHRSTHIKTIEANGGKVVKLEKDADILICDPAKKGPVPGSYSYQLIEDAIKEGSLDRKEDYLCRSPAPQSGSRPSTRRKSTRNMFTENDDRILRKFVVKMERLGAHTNGNDIYYKLAEMHPNHTWQSWRDRWVKKLRGLPNQPVSDGEQTPQPPSKPVASRQAAASEKSPGIKTRARFTAEEDELLLETIHQAIISHEPYQAHAHYVSLAAEFPQRTAQSWRERAMNQVAKRHKDLIAQWESEAGFHLSDEEEAVPEASEDQRAQNIQNRADAKLPAILSSKAVKSAVARDINRQLSQGTAGDEQEHQKSPSRNRSAGSVERSLPSEEPPANGGVSNNPVSPIASILQLLDTGKETTAKEQFYRDYNTFLETQGLNTRPIPSVGGKAIALWDLWNSVRSKKVELVELDWQQVAEDLGFDWLVLESIPDDLRRCYEEHLAPFAESMMDFNSEDLSDDDTDAEADEPLPSSPPVLSSLKRSLAATELVSNQIFPQSPAKRRRMDRNDEIPSTPDDVNGTLHLRHLSDLDKTPIAKGLDMQNPSQSASRSQVHSDILGEEGDEMRDRLPDLPSLRHARKPRLEPETQDFNFDTNTQVHIRNRTPDNADNESQRTVTPSQQLQQELDAMSPSIQSEAPVRTSAHREIAQTSPTPHRRARNPFIQDSDDDTRQSPKPTRNNRASGFTKKPPSKRRTLPASFLLKASAPAKSSVQNKRQPSSTVIPEAEPSPTPTPVKETPEELIDRFVSFGYPRDIVIRSLKATSWIIGNAGQVMEILKRGDPLPQRTTGVWTQRDDDSLTLVYSKISPADEKEEKKRAKEMRRLQAKHGLEQIALRKKYLLDELSE
ncbi:hypothetical protein F5Y19DRAFT_389744 [Xylariaceae sp. FL1651]|nr:hypothetical protein F5Y19DRAFT_389744 [Xylariaceae sp. FL1651]